VRLEHSEPSCAERRSGQQLRGSAAATRLRHELVDWRTSSSAGITPGGNDVACVSGGCC